jgi:hypothetical protein
VVDEVSVWVDVILVHTTKVRESVWIDRVNENQADTLRQAVWQVAA